MSMIKLLDQSTINKIAAGEVIDRPASVVKELLENAIDAKASSITVEIKEGGISFIRITDNGSGIPREDISVAFLRHSTSKITNSLDLLTVSSLGFRGEALSSIAAIAQVELISKPSAELTGTRYLIEGGKEKGFESIGAPNGTTFIIRNLFYNTPARRKFLKSTSTEAGYISDIVERIALSHPDISIRFINNNTNKLFTSGNNELKTIIYNLFGRDISSNLIDIQSDLEEFSLTGYIGKPVISRGNRNYENYFINGRYIKSSILSKAIEDAYKPYMMQHKYPFTVLHLNVEQSLIDVNVHPSKMEIRFYKTEELYSFIFATISEALARKEPIVEVQLDKKQPQITTQKQPEIIHVEPFEKKRLELVKEIDEGYYQVQKQINQPDTNLKKEPKNIEPPQQINLFEDKFLSKDAISKHKLLGQVFDTYWLVEYEGKLFIIDQHAAHEKVLYERLIASLKDRTHSSQMISPPLIITLSMQEEELLKKYWDYFLEIGYEIEHFGGSDYAVRAVPNNLFSINKRELFLSIIDELSEETMPNNAIGIKEKIASLSCKAAVKGNNKISALEMNELIKELLTLENPYNCPHGRPTIISMSKQELEKMFKRIL